MLEHEGNARLHNLTVSGLSERRNMSISGATRAEYRNGVLMNDWRVNKPKRHCFGYSLDLTSILPPNFQLQPLSLGYIHHLIPHRLCSHCQTPGISVLLLMRRDQLPRLEKSGAPPSFCPTAGALSGAEVGMTGGLDMSAVFWIASDSAISC